MTFKMHWLNYWMLFHTIMFWSLIFASMFKMEGLVQIGWDTLIQLWIWNLFAYLYVAFMNFLRDQHAKNKKLGY